MMHGQENIKFGKGMFVQQTLLKWNGLTNIVNLFE